MKTLQQYAVYLFVRFLICFIQAIPIKTCARLAKGIGWLEKTDHIDAQLLALYGERAELKVQQLPDEATRQLRELCARRMDLLEMIDAERNRLEHASSVVRREIARHVDYLRKRLKRIERDIDGAVRSSERACTVTACRRSCAVSRSAIRIRRVAPSVPS